MVAGSTLLSVSQYDHQPLVLSHELYYHLINFVSPVSFLFKLLFHLLDSSICICPIYVISVLNYVLSYFSLLPQFSFLL